MAITHLSPLVITGPVYSDTTKAATTHDFGNWMFSPGCGCCIRPVVGCCDPDDLPDTAALTYTIEGLEPRTLLMQKFGSGYTTVQDGAYPYSVECVISQDTSIFIGADIACFTNYWALSFGYVVYIDPHEYWATRANYVTWSYIIPFAGEWDYPIGGGIAFGSTEPTQLNPTPVPLFGTGRVVCQPCFLVEFSGKNTDGRLTASDNPQICDGKSYPFGIGTSSPFSSENSVGLDLQIAAHCDISCTANPDELMPAVLHVEITICGNITTLPNITYQEITPGNFGWSWAATEVPPVVNLVAIDGCPGSDASFETHALCLQSVFFGGCGEDPGNWQSLGLGTYNDLGVYDPKGSSGFSLTNTSPFDITYTFTDSGNISFGCCGDALSPFTVRVFED